MSPYAGNTNLCRGSPLYAECTGERGPLIISLSPSSSEQSCSLAWISSFPSPPVPLSCSSCSWLSCRASTWCVSMVWASWPALLSLGEGGERMLSCDAGKGTGGVVPVWLGNERYTGFLGGESDMGTQKWRTGQSSLLYVQTLKGCVWWDCQIFNRGSNRYIFFLLLIGLSDLLL